MRRAHRLRHAVLLLVVAGMGAAVFGQPPLAQDPAYHRMADARSCLGIPNCLNVLSNFPFAIVGGLGLALVFRRPMDHAHPVRDPGERWPYAALFGGVALTALGSAYYHLAPDNARLVWDRLPMAIGFMGLVTALLMERVSPRLGQLLFGPLLLVGAGSVAYWYWTELQGRGDLRLYILVQYGSLLLILLVLLLYPARDPDTRYLLVAWVAYAGAKGFEMVDARLFALGGLVSGHTLKHLAAAAAVACLVGMLRVRGSVCHRTGVCNLS